MTAANLIDAVFIDASGIVQPFEVESERREDGTVGPPLTVRRGEYLLILDGFADGVAGYRVK